MKLKRVLHPEIALGLRGDVGMQQALRGMTDDIKFTPEGITASSLVLSLDPNTRGNLVLVKRFMLERPRIYHMGKDFLQALSVIDQAIPLEYLPTKFFGYVSFPEETISDGEDWVDGAYITIGTAGENYVHDQPPETLVFRASYICKDGLHVAHSIFPLRGEKLSSILSGIKKQNYDIFAREMQPVSKEELVYRTLINCVLYIHSQKPEMQKAPPKHAISNSKRIDLRNKSGVENLSELPVTFVNWNYKRPKEYAIDKSFVRGHFRWQRCGANYSEVKLAWVTEHERHYDKKE